MYKEQTKLPELSRIDFEKSPFALSQKDKEISLIEGEKTELYFADESTSDKDYGFSFEFSVLGQGKLLQVDVDVKDADVWCNNDNITDWAQDCVEIYISETFNRTAAKKDGDYTYRVNADGTYYAFGYPEKVKSCITRKTETGYRVCLTIELDNEISTLDKMGFEVMAHDFDKQGNYLSSRYWNALKFSAVHIRPDYYGVIKVKEK